MRKNRNRQFVGGRYATVIRANTINNYVTNVTNVTNVTRVTHVYNAASISGYGGHLHHNKRKHAYGNGGRREERGPKLLRYCASCGVLDQNVASRMSSSELCDESAKVVRHSAKHLAHDASECVGGLVGCVCGLTRAAFKLIGAFIP